MQKDKRNPNARISTQIAIAAIALSLGMIILGLTYIISFMDIFIIIFVPFIASIVALKGDYRAQLLFLFGSFAISFISWQEGFFQFLPNAIVGLVFGNIVKKLSASFLTYLVTSIFSLLIETALIFPINFIFEVDMIAIYASLFGMSKEVFLPIFPLFYLMLTSIQTLIMFITVSNELAKLGYLKKDRSTFEKPYIYLLLDVLLGGLILIGHFYLEWLEYLSMGYLLLTLGYQLFKVIYPFDKLNAIVISIGGAVAVVLAFLTSSFIAETDEAYLSIVPGVCLLLILTIILMFFHKPKNIIIDKSKDILRDLH